MGKTGCGQNWNGLHLSQGMELAISLITKAPATHSNIVRPTNTCYITMLEHVAGA